MAVVVIYPTYNRGCKLAAIHNKFPCIIERIHGSLPGNHYDIPYLLEYEYVEKADDNYSQPG